MAAFCLIDRWALAVFRVVLLVEVLYRDMMICVIHLLDRSLVEHLPVSQGLRRPLVHGRALLVLGLVELCLRVVPRHHLIVVLVIVNLRQGGTPSDVRGRVHLGDLLDLQFRGLDERGRTLLIKGEGATLRLEIVLDCMELAHLTRHLDQVVVEVHNCPIFLGDDGLNVFIFGSPLLQSIEDLLLELRIWNMLRQLLFYSKIRPRRKLA